MRVLKCCVSFSSWPGRSRCESVEMLCLSAGQDAAGQGEASVRVLKCCVYFSSWPGRGRCDSVEMVCVFQLDRTRPAREMQVLEC